MNPLFLGLLIAGVALVVVVLVYNGLQERRARRRLNAAFGHAGGGGERAEPGLSAEADTGSMPQSVAIEHAPLDDVDEMPGDGEMQNAGLAMPLTAAHGAHDGAGPDPDIECVALLRPASPVPSAAIGQAPAPRQPKPVRWLGRRAAGQRWQTLDGAAGPWQEIAACLLLANRSGAASRSDIETFLSVVADTAARLSAPCTLPDAIEDAARAEELDRFCADLDVQIGLTILRSDLGQIAGTRLRGVAEAAGFRLNPSGHFDYLDETGAPLCTLQNYKHQEPFSVESLRVLTTPGIVLLIDVPRVADPVRVFDQMRLVAKRLAQTLEAALVDDNRRLLDDAALAAIRGQVQATAAALRAAHIEPGGTRALRLFG